MKLLFTVIFLCTVLYTFAHPAEKTESQNNTKLNVNAEKVAGQKKTETVKVKESAKENEEEKSNVIKYDSTKKGEKLKGAESVYQSLPMPFVHYPFPFVNSYTSRYFPYGYAGSGFDNVLGHGGLGYVGLGYGGLGYGGPGYGALGYAYGYGGWF